jgi:hypothetical protein
MIGALSQITSKYSRLIIFSFFFFLLIPRLHYYFFPFENSISESPQTFFYFCALFTAFIPLIYIKSFKIRAVDLFCLLFITILYFDLGITVDYFKLSIFFISLIAFNFCSDQFFKYIESFLKKDFVNLVTLLTIISLLLKLNDIVLWQDRSVAFVGNPTVWAIILLVTFVFNFTNNEENPKPFLVDLFISSTLMLSIILTKSKLGFCVLALLLAYKILYFIFRRSYKYFFISCLKLLIFAALTSQTSIVQQIINRQSESYFVRLAQYKSYHLSNRTSDIKKPTVNTKATKQNQLTQDTSTVNSVFTEYDNQFLDLTLRTNIINLIIFICLCLYSIYICIRIKSKHWLAVFFVFIVFSLLNRILMYYPISMLWALFYSTAYKKFLDLSHSKI